jgi:hypothetical protein
MGGSRVRSPPMKLYVIAESSRNTALYINNYKHDERTRDTEFGEFSSKKDGLYCNKFAGFYSQWKFITLKTQYTTVGHSSQLV